jgi:DNA modification methylase
MSEEMLLTIREASEWATDYINKDVTPSNIAYLIQYGRIKKIQQNGTTLVHKADLIEYYESILNKRRIDWKKRLGDDLNWSLSFEHVKEAETTKHVHRLHPYKGKFIPQLVEYFLDDHTDNFKKEAYFGKGEIILDPFCGSGTALIQANELGIHAIGVDISTFNAMMTNVKVDKHDLVNLYTEIGNITRSLNHYVYKSGVNEFDAKLIKELNKFNDIYFPPHEFKRQVRLGNIDQKEYGNQKEKDFLITYQNIVNLYNIDLNIQADSDKFIDKWYLPSIRSEIFYALDLIEKVENTDTKKILKIILSRTARTCRATTHADLATLKFPVTTTYYCSKHGKVCKPLFSIINWWKHYSKDTVKRLAEFDKLRTNTHQLCLIGDSRTIDIFNELAKENKVFSELAKSKKIRGIFSSPPYVGLIDYHEQHAYAYDLFNFERKDELEIGPLSKGQGKEARDSYIQGISDVLINCKKFLADNYDILLVANDKFNIYPIIAEKSGMIINNRYKRPVLNRTEKDKGAYSETVFHLKGKV